MRFWVYATISIICLLTISSVQAENKKYKKVTQSSEEDIEVIRNRDVKRDFRKSNNQKVKKFRYQEQSYDDDSEESEEKYNDRKIFKKKDNNKHKYDMEENNERYKPKTRILVKTSEIEHDEPYKSKKYKNKEGKFGMKMNNRKLQREDDSSETCSRPNNNYKQNINCRSFKSGGSSEENSEQEDELEMGSKKKWVTYVKKFAHEKQKKDQDKEIGSVLKLHKRSGIDLMKGNTNGKNRGYRGSDDDDSSEEDVHPKLFHRKFADDE